MRVLMHSLSAVSGGAISYLSNIVPLLSARFADSPRHRLQVVAHERHRELFRNIDDSQMIWITGKRLSGCRRVVWDQRNLGRIVRQAGADILFTPYQIGPHLRGTKQVLMVRNMEPFCFDAYPYSVSSRVRNLLLRWLSSRDLRCADRVIAVSGFAEKQLTDGLRIPGERIRRIYHGRATRFSPDGNPGEDWNRLKALGVEGDFLLTCGSLLPYRRSEDVIAAFNLCAGSPNADAKLVIAGGGSDSRYAETIRRAISESPYSDRIIAVGHVSQESMIALYRRCLACVIATEIEACPNIAIEAMSSGCAIISSDRPPLPEMFGRCSLVFASRDVENMARQIRACLSNEPLRKKFGERALLRAQDFSWEKCAAETYAALTEWTQE